MAELVAGIVPPEPVPPEPTDEFLVTALGIENGVRMKDWSIRGPFDLGDELYDDPDGSGF